MWIVLILSLRFDDVALVRIGKEPIYKTDEVDSYFQQVVYANSTEILAANIRDPQWVAFFPSETGLSPFYLLNVLQSIRPRRTIIGRFGCIPTTEVPQSLPFKKCHTYPIRESGFAISFDLLKHLKDLSTCFEYSIGLSLENVKNTVMIDDFSFRFLPPQKRTSGFLISYFPSTASDMELHTTHASGLTVNVMLTPHGQVPITLGSNVTFLGDEIPWRSVLDVECDDDIVIPPLIYSQRRVVGIPCFSS